MSKRKSKLLSFIAVLIVLVLLTLGVGAILKFTRLGDDLTDLLDTSFRVEYNGISYTVKNNEIYLPKGEQARFDVKSVNGYKVTITPNVTANTDFIYTVDGVDYKYSETNITKVFLSQDNMQIGYFKLNALDDYFLESVLSKTYEGKTVFVYNDIASPYLLTVMANDTTISFVICLDNIRLNPSTVVF